jgi:dolichol-phosphate mannosyltransferase
VRREIFAAIDDWAMHPRGYKVLLYLYSRALQSIGRDRVRLSEIGYEFKERQHGDSKFSVRVILQFILMLFEMRLRPRPQIARAPLLPARS